MRFWGLCKRNFLETIRDPLSIGLGIAFPALMLIMFTVINKASSMPIDVFSIKFLTPGIVVLSFAFLMMFSAILLVKDRQTSFFARMQTLPLKSFDFIMAYSLPFVPVAFLQIVVTYAIGFCFGLPFSWGILLSVLVLMPIAFLFIAIGVIMGAVCTEGQISGIGTVFINICTLLSGAWFDLSWMGGFLNDFAHALPFAHAVDATRELFNGTFNWSHLYYILGYSIGLCVLSFTIFYFILRGKGIQRKHNVQRNQSLQK